EAVSKEKDAASRQRLEKLEEELDDLEGRSAEMTARWKTEKEKVGSAAQIREAIDRLRNELNAAQRRGDLQRASEIAYGEIPPLEKRLAEEEAQAQDTAVSPGVVDAEQITAVAARWTGIPAEKMPGDQRGK